MSCTKTNNFQTMSRSIMNSFYSRMTSGQMINVRSQDFEKSMYCFVHTHDNINPSPYTCKKIEYLKPLTFSPNIIIGYLKH